MTSWGDMRDGRECARCGARRDLLVLHRWHPKRVDTMFGRHTWPAFSSVRAACLDQRACEARRAKKAQAVARRQKLLVVIEPEFDAAPRGTCRWCGEPLTGANGGRRNYCYPDREGIDCVRAFYRARSYHARWAVRVRDWDVLHGYVACEDCGLLLEERDRPHVGPDWEADHEVPLEDGGEHELHNLRARCVPCHRAKTARENSSRARRRRAVA